MVGKEEDVVFSVVRSSKIQTLIRSSLEEVASGEGWSNVKRLIVTDCEKKFNFILDINFLKSRRCHLINTVWCNIFFCSLAAHTCLDHRVSSSTNTN